MRTKLVTLILVTLIMMLVLATGILVACGYSQEDHVDNAGHLAKELCAAHGGIGYLNLDEGGDIDELRCKDGARSEH